MQKDMDYLYSLRKYIVLATLIFIVSLIMGLMIPDPRLAEDFDMLKKLAGLIKGLEPPELQMIVLLSLIFFNNALKSLMAIVLGIGFGLFPLYLIIYNGKVLGFVVDIFSKQQGILFVVAAVLPHGIIEVPVVLISSGIGFRLGYVTYLSLKSGRLIEGIKPELKQGMKFYFRRIVPLLFVAAIIETFVTPAIAAIFMKN
ncbi:MAG TPA: stage II sporulation protein M [Candidatus Methanoperedens sp.]